MKEKDYKFIVYYYGFTIKYKRLLLNELVEEAIKNGEIKKSSNFSKYSIKKIHNYVKLILSYSEKEFDNFIDGLLNHIKNNFDQNDYYFILHLLLNYFIVGHKIYKKFHNVIFIKKLQNLYNEIFNNFKVEGYRNIILEGIAINIKIIIDENNKNEEKSVKKKKKFFGFF